MIYGNYLREKYNNTAVKLADAEGVPCIMEYSKGKNLRNYEIYGNSVQDSTPTPDTPVEIQSVGDLTTKNQLPNDWENGFISTTSGNNQSSSIYVRTKDYFTLDISKNYYISSDSIDTRTTISWYFYDENKNFISRFVSYKDRTIGTSHCNVTVPTNAVFFRLAVLTTDTTIKVQIEEGSIATEYEPYHKYDIPITVAGASSETKHIYLNEPLRKVGDYADYIDFKNQKVVRNVGETTFNGSEMWVKTGDTLAGVYQGFAVSNSVYNIPKGTKLICLADKFPYASGKAANIVTIGNSAYGLRIIIGAEYVPDLDVTTFKTWLSANNVKIIYPIATPTEESISLPALKTFKGTSIMSVDTTIQPSNIKTKYVRL